MSIRYGKGKKTSSAMSKVLMALLAGLVVLWLSGMFINWKIAPLLGWDAAALVYVVWVLGTIWSMNQTATSEHAVREDPSRGTTDVIVLIASVASLIAVGLVLSEAHQAQGLAQILLVLLGIASVVLSWVVVHMIFTLSYAEMYYRDTPGGVEFAGVAEPSYQDFIYLAFTIGMTFQVSDTGFKTPQFRRMALHHSLISYLFGTVIVATTINLIAGLTSGN